VTVHPYDDVVPGDANGRIEARRCMPGWVGHQPDPRLALSEVVRDAIGPIRGRSQGKDPRLGGAWALDRLWERLGIGAALRRSPRDAGWTGKRPSG
jgi:hypothetical protein